MGTSRGKTTPMSTAGSFASHTGPKSRTTPLMDVPDEFGRKVANGTMITLTGPADTPVFADVEPRATGDGDGTGWAFESSRYLGGGEWEWVQVTYTKGEPDKEDMANDDTDRHDPFLSRCVTTIICTDPAHPGDTEIDCDDEFSDENGYEDGQAERESRAELATLHSDPAGSHLWSR